MTFLFAPGWHPAMKAVVPLRKTLKIRTIFNLLGPLVNPLRPTGQVIGVFKPAILEPMAGALAQLGVERAIVLYGREQLDEAGLGDCSDLQIVNQGTVHHEVLDPQALGLNLRIWMPLRVELWWKTRLFCDRCCRGKERLHSKMLLRSMRG